jgi:hypothetical protein
MSIYEALALTRHDRVAKIVFAMLILLDILPLEVGASTTVAFY